MAVDGPLSHYDLVVVGGGILGLAAARAVQIDRPDWSIAVVEKDASLTAHQSGRNSGVLHAGIYYRPGTLKAELCVRGKIELEAYLTERGIPFEHNGKLIIAADERELGRLDDLQRRALANGVPGLRRLDATELREIEPAAVGLAALHSPTTGVVDFPTVAAVMAAELADAGVGIHTGVEVEAIVERDGRAVLSTPGGEIGARAVLACAGLHADRLARSSGLDPGGRIVPFKGRYYRLTDAAAPLVRANIYPVPDPSLPFLGVHFTRRIDGEVWVGPTASLALGREAYLRDGFSARDLGETLGFPGLYRFLARYAGAALKELPGSVSKRLYARQARRYVPEVAAADLETGTAGIRAQFMTRRGELVDDFAFAESARIVHVLNAPSPAATASLAIARLLAAKLYERID